MGVLTRDNDAAVARSDSCRFSLVFLSGLFEPHCIHSDTEAFRAALLLRRPIRIECLSRVLRCLLLGITLGFFIPRVRILEKIMMTRLFVWAA
jgi:hypothetical protein